MTITAEDAAKGLRTIAEKLLSYEIVESEGYAALCRAAIEISRERKGTSWAIEVDRGAPIIFTHAMDKNGDIVIPMVVVDCIQVEQGHLAHSLPFTAFDIAIEFYDLSRKPVARWHVDLANKTNGIYQDGPLMHLQFGGHNQGHRDLDHPLKAPRWCHPPLDVVLMCEVVAANFFNEKWLELRDDPSWCDAIATSQRLCFSAYIDKLAKALSIRSSTALNAMWASSWAA